MVKNRLFQNAASNDGVLVDRLPSKAI